MLRLDNLNDIMNLVRRGFLSWPGQDDNYVPLSRVNALPQIEKIDPFVTRYERQIAPRTGEVIYVPIISQTTLPSHQTPKN